MKKVERNQLFVISAKTLRILEYLDPRIFYDNQNGAEINVKGHKIEKGASRPLFYSSSVKSIFVIYRLQVLFF